MYSFKEDIASRLPDNCTLSRMYSAGKDTTTIEATKGNEVIKFSLKKLDLTTFFIKLPTIHVNTSETYNDVFGKISDLFGLGLIKNVDYYNSKAVNPTTVPQYLELEISDNSYGYKGVIRCYAILDAFNGRLVGQNRNITENDLDTDLSTLKFRNYLMGTPFAASGQLAVENSLSMEFIDAVIRDVDTEVHANASEQCRKLLAEATVLETYSDGLSDIVLILSSNKELFQIRYQGSLSVINHDDDDSTSDNSQGLPDGSGEGSAENPVEGEGDLNTGEQSELPNSSTEGEGEEIEVTIE